MMSVEDNETDVSYDSSLLHPSPSVTSVARTRHVGQPFPRPASSAASISSSSSLSFLSSSDSSSSSGLSSTTLPIASHSSFSSSLLDLLDDRDEIRDDSTVGRSPRTAQVSNSLPPTPLPVRPRKPTATLESPITIASHYTRRAGRSSQRTEAQKASKSLRSYKEISRKLDSLCQDLRHRDDARHRESKELVNSITMTRDLLRDLHKLHEERMATALSPDAVPRPHVSRSASASTEITPLDYIDPENKNNPGDLDYSRSERSENHESMGSYLSSHYSDDLAAEEYL